MKLVTFVTRYSRHCLPAPRKAFAHLDTDFLSSFFFVCSSLAKDSLLEIGLGFDWGIVTHNQQIVFLMFIVVLLLERKPLTQASSLLQPMTGSSWGWCVQGDVREFNILGAFCPLL